MASPIKFKQGFEVGDARKLHAWFTSQGATPGQPFIIAPNTTVRMDLDASGQHCYIYRFYNTDVITVHMNGDVSVRSTYMSPTTKRRMNQFLAPFDCFVYTEDREPYFQQRGKNAKSLDGSTQRFTI